MFFFSYKIKKVWEAQPSSSSIVVKKGSPYYPFLTYQTLKILESGQFHQILSNEHRQEISCDSGRKKGFPIGLEKLSILFIILFFGIIFSSIIVILENIFTTKPHNRTHGIIITAEDIQGEHSNFEHYVPITKLLL
jgi:hypothetical protein